MDQLSPAVSSPKSRRRYSAEFKSRVVQACDEPGQSVAGVARRHGLNANLLQKWRKQARANSAEAFIRLPVPVRAARASVPTIRIELPGGIIVHWPAEDMTLSVKWVKALMA
jgi:transposase